MGNWLYANEEPTSPWRGLQSVPRALALRRLPEGLRLVQSPVAELASLRAKTDPTLVSRSAPLPGSADIELEVVRGAWSEAGLRLSNATGEEVVVGVAQEPLRVFVDRRRSRATAFHDEYPGRHEGPLRWRGDRVTPARPLRPLEPRGVRERRRDGLSERVYPTRPLDRLEVLGAGQAVPGPVRLHELRSVWR